MRLVYVKTVRVIFRKEKPMRQNNYPQTENRLDSESGNLGVIPWIWLVFLAESLDFLKKKRKKEKYSFLFLIGEKVFDFKRYKVVAHQAHDIE